MNKNLHEFFRSALLISENDMNTIIIEDILRIGTSPCSKLYNEIAVIFRDRETRMLVFSHARNLSNYVGTDEQPTAGMRNEIPSHLQATHKLLRIPACSKTRQGNKEADKIR